MPSSFFNKSPLKVLTPLIYSMGLVNMVETGLMGLVYTNILYPGWGRKILRGYGKQKILTTNSYLFALF